jgi:hut operon positive regulator
MVMSDKENRISFSIDGDTTVGRAAMMLALCYTREEESILKEKLTATGLACAVTGLGGMTNEVKEKITQAVLGAALHNGVINKTTQEIHALIHATMEAQRGILLDVMINTSFALKIGLASDGAWVAVAIFGQAAFHPMTNHERAGLGIMHIN